MLSKNAAAGERASIVEFDLPQNLPAEQSRLDSLVKLVDLCSEAKDIAEALGEPFLAHMIAMSILAARSEMRPKMSRENP